MADLKPFVKGERLSASKMNALLRAIERFEKISSDGGIDVVATGNGYCITNTRIPPFWAKITGGTNPYSWTRQQRLPNNTYVDDSSGMSGTTSVDPAYEWNGITTVPTGKIVELIVEPGTGQRVFQLETC